MPVERTVKKNALTLKPDRGERIVTNRLPSHRIPKVTGNRDYRWRQVIVTE